MDNSRDTRTVGLITPTYRPDLERCALLCESVDRHVTSFARHYLVVADDDVALFAKFKSERRLVLPVSQFLPRWLKPIPAFIERNRRRYWWSFRSAPVNGWLVQQLAKIAVASTMPEAHACMLDSDVAFFRPFDALSQLGNSNLTPLYFRPREVAASAPLHAAWVHSSHRLLGLDPPDFSADDFIGHVIYWDQPSARAMTARIEAVTGLEWAEALCRARSISEYMLYGYFVRHDADAMRRHRLTMETPCLSYWEAEPLGEAAIERMLRGAGGNRAAFSAQSISGTPVSRIRAVLHHLQNDAAEPSAPLPPRMDPAPAGMAPLGEPR
jgi:hypothetical protein